MKFLSLSILSALISVLIASSISDYANSESCGDEEVLILSAEGDELPSSALASEELPSCALTNEELPSCAPVNEELPVAAQVGEELLSISPIDEEFFVIEPVVEVWDVVSGDPVSLPAEVSLSSTSFSSMISSFFESLLFYNSPIPSKPSSSVDLPSLSDSKFEPLACVLNCKVEDLMSIDSASLEKLSVSILDHEVGDLHEILFRIGDKALFELYFSFNIPKIRSSVHNSKDYQVIAFQCIKMNSVFSLVNFLLDSTYDFGNKSFNFSINGPISLIVSAIDGCSEMLQFLINSRTNPDICWEWTGFEGMHGFMHDFGSEPFEAALYFAATKVIDNNDLDCLEILISAGLNISFKAFHLLKKSAASSDSRMFHLLFSKAVSNPDSVVLESVLIEVLSLAIISKNYSMIDYLLETHITIDSNIALELLPCSLVTSDDVLFERIFPFLDRSVINGKHLNVAAQNDKKFIFSKLVELASNEIKISAISSCINEVKYHGFVELILPNVDLDVPSFSQILVLSASLQHIRFVSMFINHNLCLSSVASLAFLKVLYIENPEMLLVFLNKFTISQLVGANALNRHFDKLFELGLWRNLKVYCDFAYNCPNFSKPNFMKKIFTTDHVEIASIAAKEETPFPQADLHKVKNSAMRNLAMDMIRKDLSKSSKVNRK